MRYPERSKLQEMLIDKVVEIVKYRRTTKWLRLHLQKLDIVVISYRSLPRSQVESFSDDDLDSLGYQLRHAKSVQERLDILAIWFLVKHLDQFLPIVVPGRYPDFYPPALKEKEV